MLEIKAKNFLFFFCFKPPAHNIKMFRQLSLPGVVVVVVVAVFVVGIDSNADKRSRLFSSKKTEVHAVVKETSSSVFVRPLSDHASFLPHT